jgi:hypothetical protein
VAEAGDNLQILRDCAVRKAVTYVVCDLVDKVIQQSQPPANERCIQMYDLFPKQLADKYWKSNKQFPKAGSNEELDQLITRLKLKRRTMLWQDYKSSNLRGRPTKRFQDVKCEIKHSCECYYLDTSVFSCRLQFFWQIHQKAVIGHHLE